MKGGASRGSARVKGLKGEEVHEGRGRERGKGRAIKGGGVRLRGEICTVFVLSQGSHTVCILATFVVHVLNPAAFEGLNGWRRHCGVTEA